MQTGRQNRLATEKSPYLLQHAENPVDWYPWGDEAFETARSLNKPVFLSIGYSTCHWCHVMAHESFEDPEAAALLNETFVCVKVDREERPDIDAVYMTVCQMMTGSGGWPLTIIMTPEKEPFFAGTYIPRVSRFGHTGLMELTRRIHVLWNDYPEDIQHSIEQLKSAIQTQEEHPPGEDLGPSLLEAAYRQLAGSYDNHLGGFGQAPKFPIPHNILFLLRYHKRTGSSKALKMAAKTLQEMRYGGMYDHVGSGFHRYSTDAGWLVPHFEKMLYDQALLALAYTEAWQVTGKELYAGTAHDVLGYVLRDLASPDGGFYSAEDADSEGEEGRYYVWTEEEIRAALPEDQADIAVQAFGIKPEGNYHEEVTGEAHGKNIIHLASPPEELAGMLSMDVKTLEEKLPGILGALYAHRQKRVRPSMDTKILTDWNGLVIAALAKAGRVFDREEYTAAAVRAADFISSNLTLPDGRLMHRYFNGEHGISGKLDDYAFLAWAMLELYETTFDSRYLKKALDLCTHLQDHFADERSGGFFATPDDDEKLLFRPKEAYDGAIPSGNSAAALVLMKLARITARSELEEVAQGTGKAFSEHILRMPSAYTFMMLALDYATAPSREIIIAGEPDSEDTRNMLRSLRGVYLPNAAVILVPGDDLVLREAAPYLRSYTSIGGKAAAYVCLDYECALPTTDPAEMTASIEASSPAP